MPRSENEIIFVNDESVAHLLARHLESTRFQPLVVCGVEDMLDRVSLERPGVIVVMDGLLPDRGLSLLEQMRKMDSDLPVVLVTENAAPSFVVRAMRAGAYDVLEKSAPADQWQLVIEGALKERSRTLNHQGNGTRLQTQGNHATEIVGQSQAIRRVREMIRKAGEVNADVLIEGETGTGKELVARCLHEQSPRRRKNFVAINCCAIPEQILESELFGHEPGAFTGARNRRIGRFEYAHGGTLYLDEIDSMPLHLQTKLLRVLQERTFERLGCNQTHSVDVRILASTKMDLREACEKGQFREDLYYRLNVIRLPLPPLRGRPDDIPILFQYFVMRACARYRRSAPLVTAGVLSGLMARDWPGNVRELKNVAEQFTLGFHSGEFSSNLSQEGAVFEENAMDPPRMFVEKINAFEKMLIEQELLKHGGDIKATYTALGLPRKTLYDKMKKCGLKRVDFLNPA